VVNKPQRFAQAFRETIVTQMTEFNLLGIQQEIKRDVGARMLNKESNRAKALKFDWEYFDGPRTQGYGGYSYDGRWKPIAKRLIERYSLTPSSRIIDVGAAKGFLMKDLQDSLPGLTVWGLDISNYAITHCHPDVEGRIVLGSCETLPWPDGYFDAAVAINTIHNLEHNLCVQALKELQRVSSKGKTFVQVDAYRNKAERELFEAWMLTAKTYCTPDEWLRLFEEADYKGDYYWTILELQ
jgi:cyclopropane fatty-acyl-phospholipid synthase-like methyltransferase